jgi:phosphate transport system substrate-binding protein
MLNLKKRKIMNRLINTLLGFLLVLSFTTTSYSRDQIKIVGSSTVYPYATVVAEKFGKSGKFKTPVIESTGTGGGMKLFCAGVGANHPDVTNASRAIKPKEKALCEKNGVAEIIEIVVGNDGISFAHAVSAPDANFTKEQLWRALAAKVDVDGKLVENPYKKWSDIESSLPNKKIEILIAPPTSGTRDAWNSLVMGKGCTKTAKSLYDAAGKMLVKNVLKCEKMVMQLKLVKMIH